MLLLLLTLCTQALAQYTLSYPSNTTGGPAFVSSADFTIGKTFIYNTSGSTESEHLAWTCASQCTPPFQLSLMANQDNKGVIAQVVLSGSKSLSYDWTPQGYDNITANSPFYFMVAESGGYYNYTPPFYIEAETSANISAGSGQSFPNTPPPPTQSAQSDGGGPQAGTGVLVGVIVAGVTVLAAIVAGIVWFWRRRKAQRTQPVSEGPIPRYPDTPDAPELEARQRAELQGVYVQQQRAELAGRSDFSKIAPNQARPTTERFELPVEYYGSFAGR